MKEKKITTKEDQWTVRICDILRGADLGENIYVDVFKRVPYALELPYCIFDNERNVGIDNIEYTSFETDMLVYEKLDNKIIPRVVIESKINSVTTHDAITYSQKAIYHKNLIPFLRYGIMLGNRKHYAIPGRLFKHGTHFDFMFSFKDYVPDNKEKELFITMIKKELIYSQQMEYVLKSSKQHDRTKYCMLQKEFHLEEV